MYLHQAVLVHSAPRQTNLFQVFLISFLHSVVLIQDFKHPHQRNILWLRWDYSTYASFSNDKQSSSIACGLLTSLQILKTRNWSFLYRQLKFLLFVFGPWNQISECIDTNYGNFTSKKVFVKYASKLKKPRGHKVDIFWPFGQRLSNYL